MAEVKVTKASESGDPALYPSQSDISRSGNPGLNNPQSSLRPAVPEKPRMQAVAKGSVKPKNKFLNGLYDLWKNVAKPALYATIEDMIGQGLHMALYNGETMPSRMRNRNGYVSFRDEGRRNARRTRYDDDDEISWDTVSYRTKDNAKQVHHDLLDRAANYPMATILDLYDASGITSHSEADDYRGWTYDDLVYASIESYYDRERGETRWYIKLPKPRSIR